MVKLSKYSSIQKKENFVTAVPSKNLKFDKINKSGFLCKYEPEKKTMELKMF